MLGHLFRPSWGCLRSGIPEVDQFDIYNSRGAKTVVEVSDGATAARHVYQTFGQPDEVTIDQYAISLAGRSPDFDPDILVHMSTPSAQ